MSSDVLEFINHYKKSIEKNSEDRERILHCLTRLAKLKVSVAHLQQTGIGKTVNNVRKLEGDVGELAKTLVMKWKDMVAADEKAEKMKPPKPLFKLPIKLEPMDTNEPPMELFKPPHPVIIKEETRKSSSSSNSSKSKDKSDHHSSSGSKHSDKKEESRKSSSSSKHHSSSDKSDKSHSKHHHKSKHTSSSHSESSSSSKRKREESSKENESSHKKPKLEIKTETSKKEKDNTEKEVSKSSSSSKSSPKKSKKSVEVSHDEMDGSGGMGFAEALALFDMPSSSKKKEVPLADKIVKMPSSSKNSKSSSSSSKSSESSKKLKNSMSPPKSSTAPLKNLTSPPKLLVQKPKLDPLPDIVNDLPSDLSIPEYRPAPLNPAVKDYINSSVLGAQYMKPQPRNQSDADLLTESFSSKANRTRVFSGNRVQKTVPTMFEMCIRVLQENIDFLTETGGVPFDILRPVLERAKPDQLATIEYYNSYLLDESDVLWEPHCKRKFRTRQREEMETWREMYDRCTREDEEKLSRLTRNIKQHQEKADGGVQKTKLAFVDSMVKAPRNIRHKQEIFGTNHKLVVSPAMRTVGLRNLQPNLAQAGDARLRVSAGLRDDAQQSVGRRQVKHAPMMAKILSKFKR